MPGNKKCVQISGRKCTLHTKREGEPKEISKACRRCDEWRCAKHCRCGRTGANTGRHAPRIFGAAAAAKPKTPAFVPRAAQALTSVIQAPVDSNQRMDLASWWVDVVAAIKNAREVDLASYMFDAEKLTSALLERLCDGSQFGLTMCLDRETFSGKVPKEQRPRVRKLWKKRCQGLLV